MEEKPKSRVDLYMVWIIWSIVNWLILIPVLMLFLIKYTLDKDQNLCVTWSKLFKIMLSVATFYNAHVLTKLILVSV